MNCAGMNTEYSLCSLEVKRAEAIDSAQQWACVFILFMHFSGYHCGWLTRWRWVCVCVCAYFNYLRHRERVLYTKMFGSSGSKTNSHSVKRRTMSSFCCSRMYIYSICFSLSPIVFLSLSRAFPRFVLAQKFSIKHFSTATDSICCIQRPDRFAYYSIFSSFATFA